MVVGVNFVLKKIKIILFIIKRNNKIINDFREYLFRLENVDNDLYLYLVWGLVLSFWCWKNYWIEIWRLLS